MLAARPYQVLAIGALYKGWQDPAILHQLLVMATGTGKTVIFSKLAAQEEDAGRRTLILAHTDELIDQALKKYETFTGRKATKEKAGSYGCRLAKVVIGSVQTMMRMSRLSTWPKNHFNTIVVDEAHRSLAAGYRTILKYFAEGGARVVGVTATADRGDARALGEFFHQVAFDYGLMRAVLDAWLVRPIVKTMPVQIDLRGVKSETTDLGTDLSRSEVGHRITPFIEKIAQCIKAEIGNEKVLIFMPSVETARIMSDAMCSAGVPTKWVCGDKKLCPDRTEIVASHQRGEFQGLVNMAVLTEGYDDDSIKFIVCLRATKIRSLYCQIIGRGTRPHGSCVKALNAAANEFERRKIIAQSVKPHLVILDFLWLYEKHNLCTPASLVTKDDQLKAEMGTVQGDLLEAEERAQRDLLKKLEDQVRRNSNKKSRVVDPLAIATELGDVELANYEPVTAHEAREPSDKQKEILLKHGVKVEAVKSWGQAHRLIDIIIDRHNRGLCTIRQLNFLKKAGIDASQWTKSQAGEKQAELIRGWQAKRAEKALIDKHRDDEVREVARQLNFDEETTVQANRALRPVVPDLPDLNADADILDLSDIFGGNS